MQLEFFDVPSPCVGVCQSDQKGLCLGCLRNRGERQNWNNFSCDEKQKVIKRCLQRKRRKEGLVKSKVVAIEVNSPQSSLFDRPEKAPAVEAPKDLDFSDFEL